MVETLRIRIHRRSLGVIVAGSLLVGGGALAHPLAPALLELREIGSGRVAVTWKTSTLRAPGVEITPVLPAGCRSEGQPQAAVAEDSITATWTVRCDGDSLVGASVGVDGLADARIDALVRVTLADGRVIRAVVRGATPTLTIPARERRLDVMRSYAGLGIKHLLTGFDHLLFVAGLLLLARGGWRMVETIAAFSVGHSLTLALAVFEIIRVPTRPIELLVALSVFVLAVALTRERDGAPAPDTLAWRHPWLMAFGFGLLHGLGFADALRGAGLPQAEIPLALCSFNAGVEIGQLAFITVLLAGVVLLRRVHLRWPRWAAQIPLYVMGSLAAFWCFERAALLVH